MAKAISSRPDAGGIGRCERLGVPCEVVARREYADADSHAAAVFTRLDPAAVDLVCLAGWMHRLVLSPPWLDGRVMNVHPSLLPAFGGFGMFGRRVHEAVLARGCRVSGCTVHLVDNELDAGPILVQRCVPVAADDTPDTLAKRVQAAERAAYVEAIRDVQIDV